MLTPEKEEKRTPPKKQKGWGRGPRRIDGVCLDVRAGAMFLGGTEKQVRGLIARALIPYRRLGGRIIFLKPELEQWLSTLDGVTLDEAKHNQEARR